jgi:hypothetical protein
VNWILMALFVLAIVWGVSALWSPARRRATNRLNNQGLPREVTREDHRNNDEE